ncbi:MAG: DNA helicase UvrD [Nanoarchaeota archaeon]|nr:DNA helicase UvrD [Nanoarchaeota archaeon]|tara:strand:+ start:2648 stop:3901 length:1254 start_codon:yes stop_codon:yes gene_type:complete
MNTNIIADLQIHSSHSRATSKNITFQNLEHYAKIKGLNLLGTGDFQHPLQFEVINKTLEEDDKGVLWSKTKFPFLWQTEISLIYTDKDKGKGQRVHHLIFSPGKDVAGQIIDALSKKGRLDYDGRPIFGFDSVELVDMMRSISENIEIIPAHVWTPHFSIMGEYNQLLKIEDCFKDNSKYIHALETGMSSDPSDNWRISALDKFQLVSFSDAHSMWPWRLGREATIFDFNELSYKNFLEAVRTGNGLKSTIETPTFYGKYHFSGHRNCDVVLPPKESLKNNQICPKCGRKLIVGVADRIEKIADRPEGFKRENTKPFVSLIPLHELISAVYGLKMLGGKKIWEIYNSLIEKFGNEFNVLLNISEEKLKEVAHEKMIRVIMLNRNGNLKIDAGFDGVYGKIVLDEKDKLREQKSLAEF